MTPREKQAIFVEFIKSKLVLKAEYDKKMAKVVRLRRKQVNCLMLKNIEHAEAYKAEIDNINADAADIVSVINDISTFMDQWRRSA